MSTSSRNLFTGRLSDDRAFWFAWSVAAAFGAYFCMYAFRKPFTVSKYAGITLWDFDFKFILVAAQVLGYTASKFIGIKVISEMAPRWRAVGILLLILLAEAALLLFAVLPRPWNALALFLNGLPLGMVFGLVLGFLEGRCLTEALAAGLCVSFIVADGATKSVGAWLLDRGISEAWMPCTAGAVFFPFLVLSVAMLALIPPPLPEDIAARNERVAMSAADRRQLFWKYATGLSLLVGVYLAVSILRGLRADFAPELWSGLNVTLDPGLFSRSEVLVASGVLLVNGSSVYIRDNRAAFFVSLAVCLLGFALLAGTLFAQSLAACDGFTFMVLMGLGLYLPYVAVHTTLFERLLAMTRERGNLGFLMYFADAIGYLGYVCVLFVRQFYSPGRAMLPFFLAISWVLVLLSMLGLVAA